MRNKNRSKIYNTQGFTLVELMIVVAIIGILASVSSVYFSYYQSKSRSIEGKLQLAAIYTGEEIFFQEFGIYANCLSDLGYNPAPAEKRFFSVGFPSLTAAIDPVPYSDAVDSGLPSGSCSANLAPTLDQTYFLASLGVGASTLSTMGEFIGAITSSSNSLDESTGTNTSNTDEGLGDMTSVHSQVYSIPAAAYLHIDYATPASSALFVINHLKIIRQVRQGY